jgi:hydroxymethylpyrimidine/phosphomethylpyrimidine kinase
MISKHGATLVAEDARQAIRSQLLPRAFLITPNLAEASALTGGEVRDLEAMRRAARELCEMGAHAALVKGGHLAGDAVDIFYCQGDWREYRTSRIETRHTHGTGCTYSAAIVAGLALGAPLG